MWNVCRVENSCHLELLGGSGRVTNSTGEAVHLVQALEVLDLLRTASLLMDL